MSTGRSACRSVPIATSTAMCAMRRSTSRAIVRAFARDRGDGGAHARPHRLHHLLRRRHAVADAARDRRRDPRRASPSTGRSRPTSKSRSKPIRPASRRRASAAIAPPASTACRSACRRSTTTSLKALGRTAHAPRSARTRSRSRASVFERYSFDLIYARPGQTPQAWAAELKRAIAEAAEHLSLYQLTIEADTPFSALHAAGKLTTPDEDAARVLYDATQEICDGAGLAAYEISNHARAGRASAGTISSIGAAHEYVGIGPGAHGRLVDRRRAPSPPRPRSGPRAG